MDPRLVCVQPAAFLEFDSAITLFALMAPKTGEKAGGVSEVRYAAHVHTSAVRPYPTKEGKLLRNGVENSAPEDFLKLFTATSVREPQQTCGRLLGVRRCHGQPSAHARRNNNPNLKRFKARCKNLKRSKARCKGKSFEGGSRTSP